MRPELSIETIERYNRPVPRYTSYPTVPYWKKGFTVEQYLDVLHRANQRPEPLSLYIHLPFCERRCSFCGCNTVITRRIDPMRAYLNDLKREITFISKILENRRVYSQFHIGGGTPTYYSPKMLDELLKHVDSLFTPTKDAEKSIEIHPSVTSHEHIDVLINNGFTRLSLGVQDFDPFVQEKIHRYQTYEETRDIIAYARKQGVTSINVDLIYGLPYQTEKGYARTMSLIETLQPDRLAVYSYAHLPSVFRHQSIFPEESIPKGAQKLRLFLIARNALLRQGYEQIGFDHFALPSDELYHAYKHGGLQRNFMGYTTHAGTDLLAFGYSGISDFGDAYVQNTKSLHDYSKNIKEHGVSPQKGLLLSQDDLIRKVAITEWLCNFHVSVDKLKQRFGDDARALIAEINQHFPVFEKEGLVTRQGQEWHATVLGRLFARIPASIMDAYLKDKSRVIQFSKVI